MASLKEGLLASQDSSFAMNVYGLFQKSIYEAIVLDYAVTHISNEILPADQGLFGNKEAEFTYRHPDSGGDMVSKITVQRKGDWVFPVELLITFEDGSRQIFEWSGAEGSKTFELTGSLRVVSAQIDPNHRIGLDIDWNNNSMTLEPDSAPLWKYAAKTVFWVQNLMQATSFLM